MARDEHRPCKAHLRAAHFSDICDCYPCATNYNPDNIFQDITFRASVRLLVRSASHVSIIGGLSPSFFETAAAEAGSSKWARGSSCRGPRLSSGSSAALDVGGRRVWSRAGWPTTARTHAHSPAHQHSRTRK